LDFPGRYVTVALLCKKTFQCFIFRVICFIVFASIITEFIFGFVLYVDSRPVYYQDEESRLLFFDKDFRSEGVHRYGNPPIRGGEWKVNTSGWASPSEYLAPSDRLNEVIALYGDSYVVGLNVDYTYHQDYLIEQQLNGLDVYSFAMGGMMLMQYVKLIEYAESTFDPKLHVIYVNGGDVRESLRNYSVYSLYYQLSYSDGEFSIVEPIPFRESPLKRFMRNSRLLVYLRYHRGVTLFGSGRGRVDPSANNIEGEVLSSFSSEDEIILERAAYQMLQMISDTVGDDPVVFVFDAPRGPIYRGEIDSEPYQDCSVIQRVSGDFPNVTCLELQPVYENAFQLDSLPFNDPENAHWNEYGNTVVANAVAEYLNSVFDHD